MSWISLKPCFGFVFSCCSTTLRRFGELVATSESRGLISLFHGQTECKKNKFGPPENPSKVAFGFL